MARAVLVAALLLVAESARPHPTTYEDASDVVETLDSLAALAEDAEGATKADLLLHLAQHAELFSPRLSLQYAEACHELSDEIDYREGVVRGLAASGKAYAALGGYDRALDLYFEALRSLDRGVSAKAEAELYRNLGELYVELGIYRKALRFHLKSYDLETERDDDLAAARSMMSAAEARMRLGELFAAKASINEALEIFENKHAAADAARAYRTLGELHLMRGETEHAVEYLLRAVAIDERIDAAAERIRALVNLGAAYLDMGRPHDALEQAREAIDEANRIENAPQTLAAIRLAADAYEQLGLPAQALEFHKQSAALADSLADADMRHKLAEFQAIYENEEKQNYISRLEADQQRLYRDFFIALSALFFVLVLVFWNRVRIRKQANKMLAEKNDAIVKINEELREVNRELKALYDRYETLFNGAEDAVFLTDREGYIIDCNRSAYERIGYEKSDLVGKNALKLLPKQRTPAVEAARKRLAEEGRVVYHGEQQRRDGSVFPVEMIATFVTYDGKPATLTVSRDVTKRMEAERQIRSLTQELIKAQENERQRVSRDLHDDLAQTLSTLKIHCATLFDDGACDDQTRERLDRIASLLTGSIRAVRRMAYQLSSPYLEQLGLDESLQQYCDEIGAENGLRVEYSSIGLSDVELPHDAEINLYRVAQE
ncbi:MAG: tetratricopeptide repeat protein, partial [Ignavibacteriales bacterium]|nr:tetratricopeptide repeat protein [Ignavibacteriales bacterium]